MTRACGKQNPPFSFLPPFPSFEGYVLSSLSGWERTTSRPIIMPGLGLGFQLVLSWPKHRGSSDSSYSILDKGFGNQPQSVTGMAAPLNRRSQ